MANRGTGYNAPRDDDASESTSFLSSQFTPFGVEDLEKEKPLRRWPQRSVILGAVEFYFSIAMHVLYTHYSVVQTDGES